MKEYNHDMLRYVPDNCLIKAYYSTEVSTSSRTATAENLKHYFGMTSFEIVDRRFSNCIKPDVGDVCEAYIDNEWQQVRIVQHDGENIVFSLQCTHGVEYRTLGSLLLYRPEPKTYFESLYELLEQEGVVDIVVLANKINNLTKSYAGGGVK